MKKINYLGFLSLVSLIPLLGLQFGDTGLIGFLGFAYYIRYFFVLPDELFLLNLRKACTTAYLTLMISLLPFMSLGYFKIIDANPLPAAFGLSFALSVFVFTIHLLVLEYREGQM